MNMDKLTIEESWKDKLADLIDAEATECAGNEHQQNCHANEIISFVEVLIGKNAQQEREAGKWDGMEAHDNFCEGNEKSAYARAIKDVEKLCGDTFSGRTMREHKELTEFYKGLESLLPHDKELK